MKDPWSRPTVGVPTVTDGGCAFSPSPDIQACGQPSEWHILGHSTAWGTVGLDACFRHMGIAMASIETMYEMHQYGEKCRRGECGVQAD